MILGRSAATKVYAEYEVAYGGTLCVVELDESNSGRHGVRPGRTSSSAVRPHLCSASTIMCVNLDQGNITGLERALYSSLQALYGSLDRIYLGYTSIHSESSLHRLIA